MECGAIRRWTVTQPERAKQITATASKIHFRISHNRSTPGWESLIVACELPYSPPKDFPRAAILPPYHLSCRDPNSGFVVRDGAILAWSTVSPPSSFAGPCQRRGGSLRRRDDQDDIARCHMSAFHPWQTLATLAVSQMLDPTLTAFRWPVSWPGDPLGARPRLLCRRPSRPWSPPRNGRISAHDRPRSIVKASLSRLLPVRMRQWPSPEQSSARAAISPPPWRSSSLPRTW